jgi:hypothetical protein
MRDAPTRLAPRRELAYPSGGGSPFLRIEEAAAFLGISARWLRDSDCPRIQCGRRMMFDRVELEKFARARLTRTLADGGLTAPGYCPACGRPVPISRRGGTRS